MNRFGLAVCLALAMAVGAPAAFGQAGKDLNKCQTAVAKEGGKYIRAVADAVGKCLKKMSSEVIENGATTAEAATNVGKGCVAALRKIVNTDDETKQLAAKFNAKVGKTCDPAIKPDLLHAESDTYTIGATTLSAANLNTFCQSFGGDGTIDDFDDWRDCLRTAAECQARQAVATQWPRALEYFAALDTAIAALPASTATADALVALAALDTAIEGATDDNVPELACGPASGGGGRLPVTGQTQCESGGAMVACPGGPAGQDGDLQFGEPRSYSFDTTVVGQRTVIDNATGLEWEVLCDEDPAGAICPTDHDVDTFYTWAGAFTKVANMNAANYGGHNDWRLPNQFEVYSLQDLGRYNPSIDPTFNASCTNPCTADACSCTLSFLYWSSTTTHWSAIHAWATDFLMGQNTNASKGNSVSVRAVRGGS